MTIITSRFCGRCLVPHTVELCGTFSTSPVKPLRGCSVRASNTWNCDSSVVTENLFIWISLRSNSTPHTPFPTFVFHRSFPMRRSNIFTSPLSYPARIHLSSSLNEFPNATDQQSRMWFISVGSKTVTGASGWRVSHTATRPSRPPVTISGAPYPLACPPIPSMALIMPACAWIFMIGSLVFSRSNTRRKPLKSPVASCRSARPEAPKVPHLKLAPVSVSSTFFSSVPAT
mmetsp:Transcript_9467/g.16271  ORF Transcript_9467/g.16271 Transcript_9467/m.16271 type:complete len:230 (-) Transcript_9467:275-964(-)